MEDGGTLQEKQQERIGRGSPLQFLRWNYLPTSPKSEGEILPRVIAWVLQVRSKCEEIQKRKWINGPVSRMKA